MAAFWQQVLSSTYDNHVLPFLWLKGEDRATITEYLEQMAAADIHEVCLESRTHPDFCRDGWWADLRFIIGECRRLGMKIWLLDDAHFPSGYANGALAGDDVDPALRKTVLKHRTVSIVGPQASTSIKLGNLMDPTERYLGAAAFDENGLPIDLAISIERDGKTGEARTLRPRRHHARRALRHKPKNRLPRRVHQHGRRRELPSAHRCRLRADVPRAR